MSALVLTMCGVHVRSCAPLENRADARISTRSDSTHPSFSTSKEPMCIATTVMHPYVRALSTSGSATPTYRQGAPSTSNPFP